MQFDQEDLVRLYKEAVTLIDNDGIDDAVALIQRVQSEDKLLALYLVQAVIRHYAYYGENFGRAVELGNRLNLAATLDEEAVEKLKATVSIYIHYVYASMKAGETGCLETASSLARLVYDVTPLHALVVARNSKSPEFDDVVGMISLWKGQEYTDRQSYEEKVKSLERLLD